MRVALIAVLLAAAAVAASAAPHASAAPRCAPGSVQTLTTAKRSVAAVVRRPATAVRAPGSSAVMRLATGDRYGFPTTLLVLARRVDAHCRATWFRVRLPVYPNGTTGWVRARDLKVSTLRRRIVVDLSSHRLFLYRSGRLELTFPVAVGKASTPTPRGRFYVTQRFVLPNASGPYGPRALGISAFSDVLRSWRDGGPIGLHGTNEPFSISRPVSHGCVRLANEVTFWLILRIGPGVPVTITS